MPRHLKKEREAPHVSRERFYSRPSQSPLGAQTHFGILDPSSFLYPLLLEQNVLIHDRVVLHEL